MSGTVSTRWFWSDWMSDPGLRACGYAARGLWQDLLCIAGANKIEYGRVSLNGKNIDPAGIARMTNGTVEEVVALLDELERNGVFSRDRRGVIYCRRMVRADKNRRNGRLGGNPNLLKGKENPESVQPTPKALIPEPEPSLFPVGAPEAPSEGPLDARTALFRVGLAMMANMTGRPADRLRPILGKWLKATNDDALAVSRAIEDADRMRAADPISWVEKALRSRRVGPAEQSNGKAASAIKSMQKFYDETKTEGEAHDRPPDVAGDAGREIIPPGSTRGDHATVVHVRRR